MNIQTPGIHHLALRVTDYERSKHFYLNTLGFKQILEKPGLCLFQAGNNAVAILGPTDETPENDQFNSFRIGLDHLAIGCENEKELKRVAEALNRYEVENTGIKHDETLDKNYVAFKDPDRISWEYYMV
ncbi:MAG TPA: VOC family protein [Gracilimonas sp.]|uniref:VOC family protein n=1 Tax=Gracilimonas sp. TaxID=1974203 RepID=UPI002DA8441C|nr:VOC family protein [Gracilimonas sp.]